MESRQGRYANALRRAVQVAGGPVSLARILDVPQDRLDRWLAGDDPLPLAVFLDTLDVIADGPYASEGRRIRVGVVRPEKKTTAS
jgi:hypothetical protein